MHWITPSQVQELALGFLVAFLKNSWGSCQPPVTPPSWGPKEWEQKYSSTVYYHSETCWECTSSHSGLITMVNCTTLCSIPWRTQMVQTVVFPPSGTSVLSISLIWLWQAAPKVFLKSWSGNSTAFPTSNYTATTFSQKGKSLGTLLKIHDGSSQSPSCLSCLELPYWSKTSHWEMFSLSTKDRGALGERHLVGS